MSSGEDRVVFVEAISQGRHVRVIVSGEMDEDLLDALDGFIQRRRKAAAPPAQPEGAPNDPS